MVSLLLAGTFARTMDIDYPKTKIVDHVDSYHGVAVADPYRWLEQPVTAPDVAEWVGAQNRVTTAFLNAIPGRNSLHAELKKRINYDRYLVPVAQAGKIFYSYNTGLQNQNVLYVIDKQGAQPRVLLDPNTLSADGTAALNAWDVSLDGNTLLYGIAKSGSDWLEWRAMDVTTGKDKPDVVKWSKFNNGVLDKGAKGLYYLTYPVPQEDQLFVASSEKPKINYHAFGTPQTADVTIFELKDNPERFISVGMNESRDVLFFSVHAPGSTNNRLYLQDLRTPNSPIVKLFDEGDANYDGIYVQDNTLYYTTNLDAPTGRVMKREMKEGSVPSEIVRSSKDTLETASYVGGKLLLSYMQDAKSDVRIYDLEGKPQDSVQLPGLGATAGFGGRSQDTVTYFSYADFTTPSVIYQYDIAANEAKVFRQSTLPFDASQYEAKQVFYKSKDGTTVPMFIVHKKGIKLDGKNPTLLYGYGGFNSSMTPWFSTSRTVWMDMGGVFCVANIRGGGEYGKEWHEAATKTKRQNAYDDFIAAAEWLIANNYATPKTLAIQGGSNGGLLVGACMNQRPELFGVCIPEVGVMDMLRFNQFTIGKAWEGDYGSPQNRDEFFALWRISPYHNLRKSTHYPATLVTTADTDDRVVPAHSFKYAAMLQACQAGDAPVLVRVETSAGHGGGKPISKVLEEVTDIYSFILHNMSFRIPEKF